MPYFETVCSEDKFVVEVIVNGQRSKGGHFGSLVRNRGPFWKHWTHPRIAPNGKDNLNLAVVDNKESDKVKVVKNESNQVKVVKKKLDQIKAVGKDRAVIWDFEN